MLGMSPAILPGMNATSRPECYASINRALDRAHDALEGSDREACAMAYAELAGKLDWEARGTDGERCKTMMRLLDTHMSTLA